MVDGNAIGALERLGVKVNRGGDSDKFADIHRRFKDLRPSFRRPVPWWKILGPRVWVYKDELCELLIPIPRLDVFLLFESALGEIAAAAQAGGDVMTPLSRAFVILHYKPPWWKRRVRRIPFNAVKARTWLMGILPSDVILTSLPKALIGFYEYVTGTTEKKRVAAVDSVDTSKPS